MRRFLFFLGLIWALPITLPAAVLHVLPLWICKKYKFLGRRGYAWVWCVDLRCLKSSKLDELILWAWSGWTGIASGNIVVLKIGSRNESFQRVLLHEQEHVIQMMKLGIFQPLLYLVNYLVGRFILKNVDGYFDNIFEIDARRKADQMIDVVGVIKKIKQSIKQ